MRKKWKIQVLIFILIIVVGFLGLNYFFTGEPEETEVPVLCNYACHSYKTRLDLYCSRNLLKGVNMTDPYLVARETYLPGAIVSEYDLVQTHILARHGDRSSVSPLSVGTHPVFYECGLVENKDRKWTGLNDFPHLVALQYGEEKVHSLHRSLFPGTSSRQCGMGKLTVKGMNQHWILGHLMSERYAGSLLQNFDEPQQAIQSIYVQSTDHSRTLKSAAAFMLAFLPDIKDLRRNLSIHISPGSLLQAPPPWMKTEFHKCNKFDEFSAANLKKTSYRQTAVSNYEPYVEMVVKLFHLSSFNHVGISQVIDPIVTRGCHLPHDPLPCASNGHCVSYALGLKLFEYMDWMYRNYYTLDSATVATIPLLRHSIYNIMKEMVVTKKTAKKFILSLSHDAVMAQLLVALGIHGRWLPYASHLVFELWHSKKKLVQQQQSYYVRLLLDGLPITHKLSAWKTRGLLSFHLELLPFLVWEKFVLEGQYSNQNSYKNVCM